MHSSRRSHAPRGTRAALAVLAGGVLAAASLAAAPAAQADENYLQISLDGPSFGNPVNRPVFPEGLHLVPGSAEAGSLWVRNNGPEPAHLSMAASSSSIAPELVGYLEIRSLLPGAASDATALLGGPGTCSDLGTPVTLAPGATGRVDLQAGLVLDAPNTTMSKTGAFNLLLLLDSAGGRSACQAMPLQPVQLPGSNGEGQSNAEPVVIAAGPAATVIAAAPALQSGPAAAVAPASFAKGKGGPELPERIVQASFIESTVEPIIRTWQGTLMVLLTAAFFAAAAARIRISRRTP